MIFGHWARLGLHLAPGLIGLDSGCVYGRELSALRLEDHALTQVPRCREDEAGFLAQPSAETGHSQE